MQIGKSFAIPKFMSKASPIHVSNHLIQVANKEFFNFIWRGKDKIERLASIDGIEYGGLKMLSLESMILSQRTMCLKRYIEDYASSWIIVLLEFFNGKSRRKAKFVVRF